MAATRPSLQPIKRITPAEAERLRKLDEAIIVDVRPKEAFDQRHIAGAISVPLTELRDYLPNLPHVKTLIFY
jgi:rhodanese-related sulfurtransferase